MCVLQWHQLTPLSMLSNAASSTDGHTLIPSWNSSLGFPTHVNACADKGCGWQELIPSPQEAIHHRPNTPNQDILLPAQGPHIPLFKDGVDPLVRHKQGENWEITAR